MSEETLVGYTRIGLKRRNECYVTKHNDLTDGIPDLSVTLRKWGINTWIELKATDAWPAKTATRIWWDHYTEQQALFLRQRMGWLFVRVGKTYALFTGEAAWRMWKDKGWAKMEFLLEAHRVWHNGVVWSEFIDAIR